MQEIEVENVEIPLYSEEEYGKLYEENTPTERVIIFLEKMMLLAASGRLTMREAVVISAKIRNHKIPPTETFAAMCFRSDSELIAWQNQNLFK